MEDTTLAKEDWQLAFDEISRAASGSILTISVSGTDLGAQTAAEKVAFRGLNYDPHGDAVAIDIEGLEHRITRPKQIDLAYEANKVSALEIIDESDRRHIVSFDPPVDLGTPN